MNKSTGNNKNLTTKMPKFLQMTPEGVNDSIVYIF